MFAVNEDDTEIIDAIKRGGEETEGKDPPDAES